MKSFSFYGKQFKSKKEVDDYIRGVKNKIIMKYGYSNPIRESNEYFAFLQCVLSFNSDKENKRGSGISFFYFMKDKFYKDQLRIHREDGTTIDCSYVYSKLTKISKNKRSELLDGALRIAIGPQSLKFKETIGYEGECNWCKVVSTEYEADHIYPFLLIKQDFLKGRTDIPTEFDDDSVEGGTGVHQFKESDAKFCKEWVKYHQQVAKYQVLCGSCNKKKGCKIEKA